MKLEQYSSQKVKDAVAARRDIDYDHVSSLVKTVYDMMVSKESFVYDIPVAVVRGHASTLGKNADQMVEKYISTLRELGYNVEVIAGTISTFGADKIIRVRVQ